MEIHQSVEGRNPKEGAGAQATRGGDPVVVATQDFHSPVDRPPIGNEVEPPHVDPPRDEGTCEKVGNIRPGIDIVRISPTK